ncbi:MAG: hypothetical protein LC749_03025 [Actinobacteria bacterium]|nr:hypothetical protein [Actinomycetota bacterium]
MPSSGSHQDAAAVDGDRAANGELDYADPEAGALTWDQVTRKLAGGGCAFESMNDSAYGELVVDGAKEGNVMAKDAKDPQNAQASLATIGTAAHPAGVQRR